MFHAGSHGPALHEALHILSSYHKLHQLVCVERSQDDGLPTPSRLLHSATLVLQAVAKTLRTILLPTSSKLICTHAVISDVNSVLCSTLSRVILLLDAGGADKRTSRNIPKPPDLPSLNSLVAVLASDIVVPLIKAFANLSENMLTDGLLDVRRHLPDHVTRRGLVLERYNVMLGELLTTLREIIVTIRLENQFRLDLLNVIRLSAIAEIERIYTLFGKESADNIHPPSPVCEALYVDPRIRPVTSLGRHDRLLRLGRKDALWYLCAVINDAVVPKTAIYHESATFSAVQSKSEVVLSTLLDRCSVLDSIDPQGGSEKMLKMDTVEKGMVVSVVEKIWLVE